MEKCKNAKVRMRSSRPHSQTPPLPHPHAGSFRPGAVASPRMAKRHRRQPGLPNETTWPPPPTCRMTPLSFPTRPSGRFWLSHRPLHRALAALVLGDKPTRCCRQRPDTIHRLQMAPARNTSPRLSARNHSNPGVGLAIPDSCRLGELPFWTSPSRDPAPHSGGSRPNTRTPRTLLVQSDHNPQLGAAKVAMLDW